MSTARLTPPIPVSRFVELVARLAAARGHRFAPRAPDVEVDSRPRPPWRTFESTTSRWADGPIVAWLRREIGDNGATDSRALSLHFAVEAGVDLPEASVRLVGGGSGAGELFTITLDAAPEVTSLLLAALNDEVEG